MTTPNSTPENTDDIHRYSDVDSSTVAQHHTVGIQPAQASPGDHLHDGRTSKSLSGYYSATTPPPYPVTSVASRTGAVALTAADIAAGTFGGAFTFGSSLKVGATGSQFVGSIQAGLASIGGAGSGDAYLVGDDSKLVDINVANTFGVQGQQNAAIAGIQFGSAGPTLRHDNNGYLYTSGSASVSGYQIVGQQTAFLADANLPLQVIGGGAQTAVAIKNTVAANYSGIRFYNEANAPKSFLGQFNSTWPTTGPFIQNGMTLEAATAMSFAVDAVDAFRFYINSAAWSQVAYINTTEVYHTTNMRAGGAIQAPTHTTTGTYPFDTKGSGVTGLAVGGVPYFGAWFAGIGIQANITSTAAAQAVFAISTATDNIPAFQVFNTGLVTTPSYIWAYASSAPSTGVVTAKSGSIRIGELAGAAGVYAPNDALLLYTTTNRNFSFRSDNLERALVSGADGSITLTRLQPPAAAPSWDYNSIHWSSGWTTAGTHATIGSGYSGINAAGIMLGTPHVPYRATYGAKIRHASDQAVTNYWDSGVMDNVGNAYAVNYNNGNLWYIATNGNHIINGLSFLSSSTTNTAILASTSGGNTRLGAGGAAIYMQTPDGLSYKPVNGGLYTNASSVTLKKDIVTLPSGALAAARKLRHVSYTLKADGSKVGRGLVAEEVQLLAPEVTRQMGKSDPNSLTEQDILGIDILALASLALQAIQELSDEVNILKTKVPV